MKFNDYRDHNTVLINGVTPLLWTRQPRNGFSVLHIVLSFVYVLDLVQ
jgi:hypothetical protein